MLAFVTRTSNDSGGVAMLGAQRGKNQAKLLAMLTVLEEAENVSELATVPGWRIHPLKGARKGIWSLTVTRNYRLTFRIDGQAVTEIDLEDYH